MRKYLLTKPLVLLAIAVAVVSAIATCFLPFGSPEHASELRATEQLILKSIEDIDWMTENQAEEIVEHAMAYKSAVIFCHADWHITSQITRPQFVKLAASYHLAYPKQEIGFHYLNLTEVRSKPLLLIPRPDEKHLVCSSYLIWLRDGHLVRAEFLDIDDDNDALIEITRDLTKRGITMR